MDGRNEKPDMVLFLLVSQMCNIRCKFCYQKSFGTERLTDEILYEKLKPVYPKVCFLPIVGGEVTIIPGMKEYVRWIKEQYPHIDILIGTNGVAFDEEWVELTEKYHLFINYSLNAVKEETYRQILLKGDAGVVFRKIQDHFYRLYEAHKKSNLPLVNEVSMVVTDDTASDVGDFILKALELGVNPMIRFNVESGMAASEPVIQAEKVALELQYLCKDYITVTPWHNPNKHSCIDTQLLAQRKEEFLNSHPKRRAKGKTITYMDYMPLDKECPVINHALAVMYDGTVVPCYNLPNYVLGNLYYQGLDELQSSKLSEIRKQIGAGDYTYCFARCPMNRHPDTSRQGTEIKYEPLYKKYFDIGEYKKAAAEYKKIANTPLLKASTAYEYAYCLHQMGDKENLRKAVKMYELAMETGMEPFWVFYNRADAYCRLEDYDSAFCDIKQAFQRNQKHEGVKMLMEQIKGYAQNHKGGGTERKWAGQVSLSLMCNLRHKFCFQNCFTTQKLTDDVLYEKLKPLYRMLGSLRILGGEPTIIPGIKEWIAWLREHYPYIDLEIVTNAVALDESWITWIKKYQIAVQVSVNAVSDQVFEKIMLKGNPRLLKEKIYHNLERLIEADLENQTPIINCISMVVNEDTKDDLEDFVAFGLKHGLNLSLQFPNSERMDIDTEHIAIAEDILKYRYFCRGYVDVITYSIPQKLEEQVNQKITAGDFEVEKSDFYCKIGSIKKSRQKIKIFLYCEQKEDEPCKMPQNGFVIMPDGNVYVCNNATNYPLGNVYVDSMDDLLFGKNRKQLLKEINDGDYKYCFSRCKNNKNPRTSCTGVQVRYVPKYKQLFDEGNFLEAVKYYSKIEHLPMCGAQECYEFAFCLHITNTDLEKAVRLYTKAMEQGFTEFWVKYNRADAYIRLGQLQLATEDILRAYDLNPSHEGAARMYQEYIIRNE